MKKFLLLFVFSTYLLNAQVGIGTTTPQGALDLNPTVPTNYGLVVPRVVLTSTIVEAPVTNPAGGSIAIGTVVFNTTAASSVAPPNNVGPGLYFWNGTKWIAFAGSPGGLDWSLTGNQSTTPGSYAVPGANYIGTADNTALHFSVNAIPRIRITTNGNVGIGQSSLSTVRLNVEAIPTTDSAMNVLGTGTNAASIIPTATFRNTATDYATGILANTSSIPTLVSPNIALRASSGTTSYISPTAQSNIAITGNATNLAFYGITEGTTDTNRRAAEFRTNNAGVATDNDANDPFAYLAGYATNIDVDPSGVTANRDIRYGGYFQSSANSFAYVGAKLSANYTGTFGTTTDFKIIGYGAVSTIVESDKANDSRKIMFAPEAPEVLFEDYGSGQLTNGSTTIAIDPIFSKNIFVDEKHPLKVFIQLEGDCNGVFVTNKSKNSFTVKELANGKSNVKFSWHIVGNRADETYKDGSKSTFQTLRFPDAPTALQASPSEIKQEKKHKIDNDKEIKDNKE